MKIFSQKPVLTLTLEEKSALIDAKKILNGLTDYVEAEVNELLEESGYGYDDVINALQVVGELLEVAVTPNSMEAKSMVFTLTTELMF
jgi:hypothetical protein